MKRNSILFCLFFVLTATSAGANFSGRWTGTGGASFAPGNNSNCEHVTFQFSQGFQYFDILRGEAICGLNRFVFPTGTLTVENGILKDRGLAVGMIGPDYFHISYSYRPGTLNILDVRRIEGGGIAVLHTAADSARGTTEVRADLVSAK